MPVSASQRPLQCRTPIWDPTINVKRVLLPPFGSWPWENLISWPDLLAMRLLPLGMRELWGIFARRFWCRIDGQAVLFANTPLIVGPMCQETSYQAHFRWRLV